jgi:hypothetical protein
LSKWHRSATHVLYASDQLQQATAALELHKIRAPSVKRWYTHFVIIDCAKYTLFSSKPSRFVTPAGYACKHVVIVHTKFGTHTQTWVAAPRILLCACRLRRHSTMAILNLGRGGRAGGDVASHFAARKLQLEVWCGAQRCFVSLFGTPLQLLGAGSEVYMALDRHLRVGLFSFFIV